VNRISRSLTTIYRTETLIARRRLAVVQNQTVLMALAGVVALIGLILVNVSLFFVLKAWVSPAAASGILAVCNLALAALLASAAGKMNVEAEIAPAVEVRDLAIADLEAEIGEATKEARDIAQSLKGLHKDPLGSMSNLLIPLLTLVLKKKT
jgi:hypothetical protein